MLGDEVELVCLGAANGLRGGGGAGASPVERVLSEREGIPSEDVRTGASISFDLLSDLAWPRGGGGAGADFFVFGMLWVELSCGSASASPTDTFVASTSSGSSSSSILLLAGVVGPYPSSLSAFTSFGPCCFNDLPCLELGGGGGAFFSLLSCDAEYVFDPSSSS